MFKLKFKSRSVHKIVKGNFKMAKIAVVGAGPSGSSTGYHLAKNGHHVTLIDKESFPRDKACGDGITAKAVRALTKMGIDYEYLKKLASEYYLWNSSIISYYSQEYHQEYSDWSICIPRYIFDNIIYEKAIEAGCIHHQQSVNNISQFRSNFNHEFDYIVDARGIFAGECNVIGIREYWTLPIELFPHYYHSNIQVYLEQELGSQELGSNGYLWIFPVGLNDKLLKINVGLGLSLKDYERRGTNLIRFFDEFVVRHHVAGKFLDNVVTRTRKKVYPLATTKWNNKIYENNIFKVGDAANLTDPVTGEGIHNAIASGFYLAQAINMSEDIESVKINYQKFYQKYFQKKLRTRLLQEKMLSLPVLRNFLLYKIGKLSK
ncbi:MULTISPECIES: NAD(P)/FAD-dependent oxidoreductase [unclassified Moorena]|uniref:NAD(P)/FAD-dependent oxidoreductase n=1 Tax=unclassified Moorena TaxID=2683338 RepID=UPI0025FD1F9E|nr:MULTISPECIES: NAD(P)/FAD-dependent oxidoreductase [unclassified Moorena]